MCFNRHVPASKDRTALFESGCWISVHINRLLLNRLNPASMQNTGFNASAVTQLLLLIVLLCVCAACTPWMTGCARMHSSATANVVFFGTCGVVVTCTGFQLMSIWDTCNEASAFCCHMSHVSNPMASWCWIVRSLMKWVTLFL